jgi:hypothetical protein
VVCLFRVDALPFGVAFFGVDLVDLGSSFVEGFGWAFALTGSLRFGLLPFPK